MTVDAYIIDQDGGFTEYTKAVTVTDVPPAISLASATLTLNQGATFSQAGLFSERGSGTGETYSATVNYGDGSGVQPLTLTDQNFSLSHLYTAAGTDTVTVTVTDTTNKTSPVFATFPVTVNAPAPFQVSSFSPTADGFVVTFNYPVVEQDVHLYDGKGPDGLTSHYDFANGEGDVYVTGPSGSKIDGSLVWGDDSTTATWVATAGAFTTAGTYNVTLWSRTLSGADYGWWDENGDGLQGGSTTESFAVASGSGAANDAVNLANPVVSIPDFARGPTQPVDVYPTARRLPCRAPPPPRCRSASATAAK
ncbi:MAG: PKD domain-containing protein [Thermoguttaceae bacterium]